MLRFAKLIAFCAMLLACIAYATDWAAWRVRLHRGTAIDAVEVSKVSVATLKGNKEEYFSEGMETVACSRSIFPMPADTGWTTTCWWLRRHSQVVEHY